MSDMTLAPRRRPLWRLFIMPVLLLIAAAAWSAFWFYAASQVDVAADAWRAQEAKSGRIYDCAKRSVAGFPFRLEVRCDGASVSLISQTAGRPRAAPVTAKLGEILVVAQVYDPKLLIAEFTAPATISESRPRTVDDGELEQGSLQRDRIAGRPAAGLDRLRRCRDRPRRRIDADAAGARQTHRVARPPRGRFRARSSADGDGAADRGRQRAGPASIAGGAIRRRCAYDAQRAEGFFAKTLAGAVSRNPGRGRACRDRAVANPAGRSDRGRRRYARPQRQWASRRRIADDGRRHGKGYTGARH